MFVDGIGIHISCTNDNSNDATIVPFVRMRYRSHPVAVAMSPRVHRIWYSTVTRQRHPYHSVWENLDVVTHSVPRMRPVSYSFPSVGWRSINENIRIPPTPGVKIVNWVLIYHSHLRSDPRRVIPMCHRGRYVFYVVDRTDRRH